MPIKKPPTPLDKKRKKIHTARRGPLSNEEKERIKFWMIDKTAKEIGLLLNRPISQIDKYLEEIVPPNFSVKNVGIDINERQAILRALHGDPSWTSLQKQFTPEELAFFENDFINYHKQFGELTTSETKQVYQLITLDIKTQRHNVDEMKNKEEINSIEKTLDKIRKEYKGLIPAGDEMAYMQFLENQLMGMRAAKVTHTKEYNDLIGKHQDILKALKGTRDQRIKSIEDRGKFMSILKDLELAESRHNIGEMIGLHELAMRKEKERLSQPFLYADKTIDQPILEPDNILLEE